MTARHFEGIAHAALYAKFRPVTPSSLIKKVISFLKEKYHGDRVYAADVGCGSGQSTYALEPFVSGVTGLDISIAQINEAVKKNTSPNVIFKVSPEDSLPFDDESLHIITVGQAAHWFDMPKFFKEANRILVPNGVIAIYGYNLPHPVYGNKCEELFKILYSVYKNDTGGLWGKERRFVDSSYADERFYIPYHERIRDDSIVYEMPVTLSELQGYISTWSGFQKMTSIHGDVHAQNVMDNFIISMMAEIGETSKTPEEVQLSLQFPFFLLMGRKPN